MSLKKIARWVGRRLTERSTYAGAAIVAGALGAQKLGVQIDQVGQAVGLILGGGLIGLTSSAQPSSD